MLPTVGPFRRREIRVSLPGAMVLRIRFRLSREAAYFPELCWPVPQGLHQAYDRHLEGQL
jgi:hypothetical protein